MFKADQTAGVEYCNGVPTMQKPSDQDSFLRLRQIIGDCDAVPRIEPLVPVSRSTWWAGVASGRFPKPLKLGPRLPVWRKSDILALIREGR